MLRGKWSVLVNLSVVINDLYTRYWIDDIYCLNQLIILQLAYSNDVQFGKTTCIRSDKPVPIFISIVLIELWVKLYDTKRLRLSVLQENQKEEHSPIIGFEKMKASIVFCFELAPLISHMVTKYRANCLRGHLKVLFIFLTKNIC